MIPSVGKAAVVVPLDSHGVTAAEMAISTARPANSTGRPRARLR